MPGLFIFIPFCNAQRLAGVADVENLTGKREFAEFRSSEESFEQP